MQTRLPQHLARLSADAAPHALAVMELDPHRGRTAREEGDERERLHPAGGRATSSNARCSVIDWLYSSQSAKAREWRERRSSDHVRSQIASLRKLLVLDGERALRSARRPPRRWSSSPVQSCECDARRMSSLVGDLVVHRARAVRILSSTRMLRAPYLPSTPSPGLAIPQVLEDRVRPSGVQRRRPRFAIASSSAFNARATNCLASAAAADSFLGMLARFGHFDRLVRKPL